MSVTQEEHVHLVVYMPRVQTFGDLSTIVEEQIASDAVGTAELAPCPVPYIRPVCAIRGSVC